MHRNENSSLTSKFKGCLLVRSIWIPSGIVAIPSKTEQSTNYHFGFSVCRDKHHTAFEQTNAFRRWSETNYSIMQNKTRDKTWMHITSLGCDGKLCMCVNVCMRCLCILNWLYFVHSCLLHSTLTENGWLAGHMVFWLAHTNRKWIKSKQND